MTQLLKVSAIVFVCVFVPASSSSEDSKQAAPAAPQSEKADSDDPVVARILGETITEKQLLRLIDQMARRQPLGPQQMQQRESLLFGKALESLIGRVLLKIEGKEMKLTADKAKVDESFQELVKRFPSEQQFKTALEKQGISESDLRASIEESIFYQQVIDQALRDVPAPTDADVKKFYDENPQYFSVPDQVRASHILLKVDTKSTPEQKASIRKKLEDLRADIESMKIAFAEAATKNSQDEGSAAKGGDLGFFGRGQMVKPFEDAAFSAKPGTVTPVVETQFGFHLINVAESRPAGKKPLEEAKADIQGFLAQKSKEENLQKHIEGLRAKAKVETVMTEEQWKARRARK